MVDHYLDFYVQEIEAVNDPASRMKNLCLLGIELVQLRDCGAYEADEITLNFQYLELKYRVL